MSIRFLIRTEKRNALLLNCEQAPHPTTKVIERTGRAQRERLLRVQVGGETVSSSPACGLRGRASVTTDRKDGDRRTGWGRRRCAGKRYRHPATNAPR